MKFVTVLMLMYNIVGIYSAPDGTACSKGPNDTDPNECCPAPMIAPVDIIKECYTTYVEMQKKKSELPGPKRGCCIGECITEKLGVNPNGDGSIDRVALKTKLQEAMNGDESWITALNNAFDTCFAQADSKAAEFQTAYELKPAFDGEKICHPISGYTLNCITNEIFVNCPSNMWKSSGECDDIKGFVKTCEYVPRKK